MKLITPTDKIELTLLASKMNSSIPSHSSPQDYGPKDEGLLICSHTGFVSNLVRGNFFCVYVINYLNIKVHHKPDQQLLICP